MHSKEELCLARAADGWSLYRIARVLNISERQVIRYVFNASTEKERVKRPRKPAPIRL